MACCTLPFCCREGWTERHMRSLQQDKICIYGDNPVSIVFVCDEYVLCSPFLFNSPLTPWGLPSSPANLQHGKAVFLAFNKASSSPRSDASKVLIYSVTRSCITLSLSHWPLMSNPSPELPSRPSFTSLRHLELQPLRHPCHERLDSSQTYPAAF